MSILRSIGNRFRRDENEPFDIGREHRGSGGWKPPAHAPPHAGPGFLGGRIAVLHNGGGMDDMPDLYYEDVNLGETVQALEAVRQTLSEITQAVNEHKGMLCAAAGTQRAMGELLVDAVEPREIEQDMTSDGNYLQATHQSPHQGNRSSYTDLDLGLRDNPEGNENEEDTPVGKFLSLEAIAAQKSLGHSFVTQSGSMVKLATAFSNPINELHSSFEERYNRKIVPLRRRYMDQKGQYLKYKRYAEAAEDDEKRSYYDALAQAARPVWIRTSKELRTEAQVMTEVTSRNIAKWGRSLALQHERSLAVTASNFADAFHRAKGK